MLPTISKICLLLGTAPAFAESSEAAKSSEPAGFLLLVLGLAVLLLGMRNLRDLRQKRMTPPALRRPQETENTSASAHHK